MFHVAACSMSCSRKAKRATGSANNVLGKLAMPRAAAGKQVDHFLQISTDKAVNPSM